MPDYRQCLLERQTSDGVEKSIQWIENNQAQIGRRVIIKSEFWYIQNLGERTLTLYENKKFELTPSLDDIYVSS